MFFSFGKKSLVDPVVYIRHCITRAKQWIYHTLIIGLKQLSVYADAGNVRSLDIEWTTF